MSLNLGTLTGFLDLDASAFDSELSGAESKLSGFGGKGAAIAAAAGLAIATALVAGVVGGMNVEQANDKLAAQLGLSAAESERVGGVAGSLYANAYGDSLGQVNTAVAAVMTSIEGMRSASSADIEATTATALDFATAMEVDVATAAQSVGILVRNGLAKDAASGFDLLTAAAQKAGPQMVEPVMEAANEYGTYFAAMGFSGEEAMGILVEASKGGEIALDKAGDAVKEFGIRAADLGDTGAQEALAALGLSGTDMANQLLAGGETASTAMGTIVGGLRGVKDPAKQAELAVALFGTPLEDIGKDKIPAFLDSLTATNGGLENVEGSAGRLSDTLNDNASTSLTSLKRQAEQAVIAMANGLLPAVNDTTSALAKGFGPAVSAVTGFLGDHETIVKAVAGALGVGAAVIGTVIGVTKAWSIAQAALNIVMAMNPFVLVAALVAALVVGLVIAYRESETFRNIVNGAFDAVKVTTGNVVGFMIDGFRGLLGVWLAVAGGIVSGAATALGWVPGVGDKLKVAEAAFNTMKDGILGTLDDAADKAYGFGEKSGANAAGGLRSRQGDAFNAGAAVGNDMGRGVGSAGGGAFHAAAGVGDQAQRGMAQMAGAAYNAGARVGSDMGRGVGAGSGQAYGAGVGVGESAGAGLVAGLNSYIGRVTAASRALAAVSANSMKAALRTASPSRVTMEIGQMVGEGLAAGMLTEASRVGAASGVLAMAALPSIDAPGIRLPAGSVRGGDGGSLGRPAAAQPAPVMGGVTYNGPVYVVDPDRWAQEQVNKQRDAAAAHGLASLSVIL